MKRRTYLTALGTVATASGAFALTSAAFASSVTPTSDFRVLADRELIIEAGDLAADAEDVYAATSLDWNTLEAEDTPVAYVNDQQNEDLEAQTAIQNQEGKSVTFDEFFKVRNPGNAHERVGITWEEFGSGVINGAVEEQSVVDTYTFQDVQTGDQISPSTPNGEPENWMEIGPGGERHIMLSITGTSDFHDEVATEAETTSGDPFSDGGTEDLVQVLDTIRFGTESE